MVQVVQTNSNARTSAFSVLADACSCSTLKAFCNDASSARSWAMSVCALTINGRVIESTVARHTGEHAPFLSALLFCLSSKSC